ASGLAQRLLFDDDLVILHALAVERRRQQPSPTAVIIAVEREYRTGAEHSAEIGLDIAKLLRAGGEDLLGQLRFTDHHDAAEHRKVKRENAAVAARQPSDHRSS